MTLNPIFKERALETLSGNEDAESKKASTRNSFINHLSAGGPVWMVSQNTGKIHPGYFSSAPPQPLFTCAVFSSDTRY